jgi:hypothetical protein
MAWLVRAPRTTDQSYVARTWVASMTEKGMWHRRREVDALNELVNRLLDHRETKLLVACEPGNEDRIVGWIAYATPPGVRCLLYVNVRRQHRRQGCGHALAKHAGLDRVAGAPPMVYLFSGPDARKLLAGRPDVTHLEPSEYLP